MEIRNSNHSKVYVSQANQNALGDLLLSILQNVTEICDALKMEVAQSVETSSILKETAKALVSVPAVLASNGIRVVKIAFKKVSQASQPEVSAVLPPPPPNECDSLTSKGKEDRAKSSKKSSGKSCHCRKRSRLSLVADKISKQVVK